MAHNPRIHGVSTKTIKEALQHSTNITRTNHTHPIHPHTQSQNKPPGQSRTIVESRFRQKDVKQSTNTALAARQYIRIGDQQPIELRAQSFRDPLIQARTICLSYPNAIHFFRNRILSKP
ncbi:hypothetical protein PGTUg99_004910, partial [Puccinia graminis f. sp. tritici]